MRSEECGGRDTYSFNTTKILKLSSQFTLRGVEVL